MGKEKEEGNIRTFLRVKPSSDPSGFFAVDEHDDQRMRFTVPVNLKEGEYVNNTRTQHDFKFDGVLGAAATQEDVFGKIGRECVRNVLDGYNSTIFAYGQTGSGKTFTVTGGADRYADRGIIPRSLSMMFEEFRKRSSDAQYTCHISYLEIYNEQGYDLLDSSHDTANRIEDLPRIGLMEDEDGNIHLRNLRMYMASSEEEALNYLFLGDTNRAIAETAMNKTSTRSHCIFTVSVEGRRVNSDTVLRSKLHLVDLAGSERVHKTNSTGQTLKEAKFINVSLFYLEMVIVALHEKAVKGRQHVPYRNSMMTSVLRDSLGGNCRTVMIATINPEAAHTEESISTCRFAQRVSLIKNDAIVNEDVDPALVIRRLRQQTAEMRDELAFLKGEAGEGEELTSEQLVAVEGRCAEYVANPDPTADLYPGQLTLVRIRACFRALKALVLAAAKNGLSNNGALAANVAAASAGQVGQGGREELQAEVLRLSALVRQRDTEIAILVNMVKQGKAPPGLSSTAQSKNEGGNSASAKAAEAKHNLLVPMPPNRSLLDDAQAAFAYFLKSHPAIGAMEENKTVLRDKYSVAKGAGERVNRARDTINYLKRTIEQIRRERAMEGLKGGGDNGEDEEGPEDPEEQGHKAAIDEEKRIYKEGFQELRQLKAEIEHIQKLLNKSRARIQTDFDVWYERALAIDEEESRASGNPTPRSNVSKSPNCTSNGASSGQNYYHSEDKEAHAPSAKSPAPGRTIVTGDKEADEEIAAFYRAKAELERRRKQQQEALKS